MEPRYCTLLYGRVERDKASKPLIFHVLLFIAYEGGKGSRGFELKSRPQIELETHITELHKIIFVLLMFFHAL